MAPKNTVRPVRLAEVTDAQTGITHLVSDEAMAAAIIARSGSYLAACGAEVLTASLTTPESAVCRRCRTVVGGDRRG